MGILDTARNNYLLAQIGINSIQKLYDDDDLPQVIEKVDGFFYDVFPSVINKYIEFETTLTTEINTCMGTIRDEADLISRDVDIQQFLDQNQAVFKPSTIFPFDNVGLDEKKNIVADEITKIFLGRKLGELMALDNVLVSNQETKEKELKGAEQLVEIDVKSAPQTGNSAISPLELKQDILNSLDLIKCRRTLLIQQIKLIKSFNGLELNLWNLIIFYSYSNYARINHWKAICYSTDVP